VPQLTPFVTPANLRDVLGPTEYIAIFDDAGSGNLATIDASGAVGLCIRRAHTRVMARVGSIYKTLPDGADPQIPDLLFDAELNYAIGIAYDRRAEYTRAYGKEPARKAALDQAEMAMEQLQAAITRIVDAPPQASPENVGGVVFDSAQRVFAQSPDGTNNSGDF
jgi:hypothetical protein